LNRGNCPSILVFERAGRWAAALRRHGLADRCRLIECRSLVELEEQMGLAPTPVVGLELIAERLDRLTEWIAGRQATFGSTVIIVFSDRNLRGYELLCREAGATHFVSSELDVLGLKTLVDRYLSLPAFATLDEAELSPTARILASLPWGR
jgi:hypothetical protein